MSLFEALANPSENDHRFNFTHFQNADQCTIYLRNNPRIVISHLCCGGTGYAVPRHTRKLIKSVPKPPPHETSQGTCDICFLENLTLHHTCTSCKQPFCLDCLQKLKTKTCPNCRSPLRDI